MKSLTGIGEFVKGNNRYGGASKCNNTGVLHVKKRL